MSLEALIPIAFKTSIFLTVLSLGLRASARDLVSLVQNPSRLARAIGAMNVVMPVVAVLIALLFALHPAVKIALVALSVSPVPPFFPKRSLKSGGTESFTLGLLVASAALSIVVIPIAIQLIHRVFAVPLRMPADAVARTVLVTILLPLFLGVTVRQLVPRFAASTAKPFALLGTGLLAASALPVVFKMWPAMMSLVGDGTLLAMISFVLIGLAVGHLLGGPLTEDRSVLALACASRHPAIAIAIGQVNYPDQRLVPAAIVLYLLVSAVVATPYLKWVQRPAQREVKSAMPAGHPGVRAPR